MIGGLWNGVLSSRFYGVNEMKWCLKEKNLNGRKFDTKSGSLYGHG